MPNKSLCATNLPLLLKDDGDAGQVMEDLGAKAKARGYQHLQFVEGWDTQLVLLCAMVDLVDDFAMFACELPTLALLLVAVRFLVSSIFPAAVLPHQQPIHVPVRARIHRTPPRSSGCGRGRFI